MKYNTMGSKSQYHPVKTIEDGGDVDGSTIANQHNDENGTIAMQSFELQQVEEEEEIRQNTRSLQSTLLATACLLASLVMGAIFGRSLTSMSKSDLDGSPKNGTGNHVPINLSHNESNAYTIFKRNKTSTKVPIQSPKNDMMKNASVTNSTSNENLSTDPKQVQINNYKEGKALLLNIHITHHAGTSVCGMMRKLGPTPGFACMSPGRDSKSNQDWPPEIPDKSTKSWSYNQTAPMVSTFRPYFHFMSWEYSSWGNLHKTNWEYENLVSMIVMRDPIERFLAGGKPKPFHDTIHGDPTPENMDLYWEYAQSNGADNFALRVLADNNCVNGSDTPLSCLQSAQSLLRRMTFILDEACLAESMVALGKRLSLDITVEEFEGSLHRKHPGTRERIGNDTLFEYLQHKMRRDIELYEWSKTQSVLQC